MGNTKAVILHLNANILEGLLRRCDCVKCNYKESRQGVDEFKALFVLDVAGKAGNVKNLNHRVCAMKNPDRFAFARRSVHAWQSQAHIPGCPQATWVVWLPFSPEGMRVFVRRWVKICNSSAVSVTGYARRSQSCWRLGCSWWSSSNSAAEDGTWVQDEFTRF